MVELLSATTDSLEAFKTALQDAFRVAAEAERGQPIAQPIPSDEDIEQSIAAAGAVTYWIMANGQRVGGAVVIIDESSNRNELSFFFVSTHQQGRGLGLHAWKAIENAYPNTKIWETVTPYFEKRNIHFYVNKCGFKIVEFYNAFHADPHQSSLETQSEDIHDEMFRFTKAMTE